ncbi:TPA: hypothetical protein JG889_000959 [Enterobacter hormaechei subsp. steigerwaltii]|uniref:hypothetical protein n=1 Tax=Enterobacter cloacae complex sp. S1 TaxID=2779539 RepID=UPI001872B562|nr:hypothetical protein [Enterobacter cloacae complex sp. S1]MBE4822793.1 hypothetical protein [Enterobacter cloacae complex sp. S1]MBE4899115.1 hypothetical protein [Enterobacter cloacae complex sp. P8RS]HAV1874337.1 hypothetical protein [Enterobacter hormaechei subsp. steigerwaltii]
MLEKIRFTGFDIEGSSLYINENDDSEGGKYNLKFSDQKVTPQLDDDGNFLFIEVTPTMQGYSRERPEAEVDEDEDVIFQVQVKLTLTFECFLDEELTQDIYNENSWFFENYVYICTKQAIEKMLKDTVLETISLPWSPVYPRS